MLYGVYILVEVSIYIGIATATFEKPFKEIMCISYTTIPIDNYFRGREYVHPNFNYWTLFISGTKLRTDGQTDGPITRCPRWTFQAGA